MKCPRCRGLVEKQHDRTKCLICGYSEWKDFHVRKPMKSEQNIIGQGRIGVTA